MVLGARCPLLEVWTLSADILTDNHRPDGRDYSSLIPSPAHIRVSSCGGSLSLSPRVPLHIVLAPSVTDGDRGGQAGGGATPGRMGRVDCKCVCRRFGSRAGSLGTDTWVGTEQDGPSITQGPALVPH